MWQIFLPFPLLISIETPLLAMVCQQNTEWMRVQKWKVAMHQRIWTTALHPRWYTEPFYHEITVARKPGNALYKLSHRGAKCGLLLIWVRLHHPRDLIITLTKLPVSRIPILSVLYLILYLIMALIRRSNRVPKPRVYWDPPIPPPTPKAATGIYHLHRTSRPQHPVL